MGLFDKFKSYKEKRINSKVEKYVKYVKNPKAIREDRDAAIDFFCSLDDAAVAAEALLYRFEYSLEHGINDAKEKEKVLNGLVKHGAAILPIVQAHLQKTSRIAWPIKVLEKIAEDEKTVTDVLKTCLDLNDVSFDQAKVDKNFDILCFLREFKLPGFLPSLKHFLSDLDERVRFAALEVIIEQEESEVPAIVEKFLSDNSSENTRLRQAAIEAFIERKWPLKNPQVFSTGFVIPGVRVNKQGLLER
ncbi:MAG: hypothetical protein KBD78_02195 [Oligoflexales bacterium]|nr:hypothetical protein [Oligoflexales bacterium]